MQQNLPLCFVGNFKTTVPFGFVVTVSLSQVLSAHSRSKSNLRCFLFGLKPSDHFGLKILGARSSKRLDMATRRVRYTPLATDEDDYIGDQSRPFDPRFDYMPRALDRVPWKSIALALFLLFLGTGLLFLSYFIFTGHMGGERSQAYGLLALGFLSFLPGFYETRLAYYAWRGAKGYRFSAIPDY